jgi:hypothetical protein
LIVSDDSDSNCFDHFGCGCHRPNQSRPAKLGSHIAKQQLIPNTNTKTNNEDALCRAQITAADLFIAGTTNSGSQPLSSGEIALASAAAAIAVCCVLWTALARCMLSLLS